MVTETEITILRQIETPEAYISMRSDDIVHVHFKENVTLDVEMQSRMVKTFNQFIGGEKAYFIFETDEGFVLTKEARENSGKLEKDSPVKASALIVRNLASRLVANFFVKVQKPKIKYKLFADTTHAAEWLKSL